MMNTDFNSLEYKRSRAAYMAQCTIEYLVSILVGDVFLAKLLTSIGISDALSGIISSFVTLAFIIQLFSIFLMKTKFSVKGMVMLFDTASIFFFMFIFFIPVMPINGQLKMVLVVLGVLFAYAGKYLILSMCFKWANEYVNPEKRAVYSAKKEMLSLFTGMGFTVAVGYIIDLYESIGNLNGAFLFIGVSILILNICNFICLAMIKKDTRPMEEKDMTSIKEIVKHTLLNKRFRPIIILTVLWDVARYFTVGFLGVFKTNTLLLSVTLIQVINVASNILRILVSVPFGRYSDKNSFIKGFKLALCIAALAFFTNVFTTNSRWYLIIVYTMLFSCSNAGLNQNSFNITYSYVESKYITQAMAMKNCIGGVCGFFASIAGGKVLDMVQSNGDIIFGMHIYGQQLLSAVSTIITIAAIIYISLVIEKKSAKKC